MAPLPVEPAMRSLLPLPAGRAPQRPRNLWRFHRPPLQGVGRQNGAEGPWLPALLALLAFGSAGRVPHQAPSSPPLRGPSAQGLSSPYPLRGPGSGIPCASGSCVPGASPGKARVRPLASLWERAEASLDKEDSMTRRNPPQTHLTAAGMAVLGIASLTIPAQALRGGPSTSVLILAMTFADGLLMDLG